MCEKPTIESRNGGDTVVCSQSESPPAHFPGSAKVRAADHRNRAVCMDAPNGISPLKAPPRSAEIHHLTILSRITPTKANGARTAAWPEQYLEVSSDKVVAAILSGDWTRKPRRAA